MDICSLTRLIAACHVLHRLLMPRHSPCALISLTIFSLLILRITLVILSSLSSNYVSKIHCKIDCSFITFKTKKTLILYFYSRLLVNLYYLVFKEQMVGLGGLEPPTSRLSGVRSNLLSYRPPSSAKPTVVEMRRIELLTPCLQGRCSPS